MDLVISRMMRLIAVVNVLGMVFSGVYCAQSSNWGYTAAFLIFALICAGLFTVIFAIWANNLNEELKGRSREEITKQSVIGPSIAVLALFCAAGFVTAGVAATYSASLDAALWMFGLSGVGTGILSIIWCCFDFDFVKKSKG